MDNLSPVPYLRECWLESGVERGDTLLIHSDVKRTLIDLRREKGYKDASVEHMLDSFLEAVGVEGTLILPLFNFDFTKGVDFDIRNTPSQMGVLTEAGRRRPNSVRTGHPVYSFCVIGSNAKHFKGVDNKSGYAEDSPFGILRSLDGKIGVLDLDDQSSMTFYHHVEEIKQVEYRYYKDFSGLYTNTDGKQSLKTYSLYVRDLGKNILTHVNPAGELMWSEGLYTGFHPKTGNGLRVVSANKMFDFVSQIIDRGNAFNMLYRIGET